MVWALEYLSISKCVPCWVELGASVVFITLVGDGSEFLSSIEMCYMMAMHVTVVNISL